MSLTRVYVVTGANKGLGKSIVKLLLCGEENVVYLTSRNIDRGKQALKEFKDNGLHPLYHQLDITDIDSINTFRDYLMKKHGGLDVLINNAGIAYKVASKVPFAEQAQGTIENDFFGTRNMCDIFSPILRKNGRVVNVSAQTVERVYPKLSDQLKSKFSDDNLNMQGLEALLLQFVKDAKENQLEKSGWPQHAYGMAKIGINFMTILQQKHFDEHYPEKNIAVNCCCPGTVDTDMTGGKYPHAISPDEAADTPVYLACLPNDTDVKGRFVILRDIRLFPMPDLISFS